MEKYRLYTYKSQGKWSLRDREGNRLYMGFGNPYKDAVYASLLNSALGANIGAELKEAFAGLGFTGHPLMLSADERSCTAIRGEFSQ